MVFQNLIFTTAGLILGTISVTSGQSSGTDSCRSKSMPGQSADTEVCTEPDNGKAAKRSVWRNIQFTGGQLTLPFKIRPKAETHSFRLTTDVTVGAFVGITKRLSGKKEILLTIPVAAGLTFVNLNNNNTTLDLELQDAEVVPGLTWSTGIILQLEQYSLGLMLGKDYASEVGNQWEYHRKVWWSFGIGFTFFH